MSGSGAARRRAPEQFSLSFLDVICCGFGAIILLLMITKTVEPQIIEASTINLEGRLADLEAQLFEIRGETRILNRDLNAKQEQLSDYKERIAILQGQLARARSRYQELEVQTNSNDVIRGQLAEAKQALSQEMKKLLGLQYQPKNNLIGGIPADSEYIIFVIDNSGSMLNNHWGRVIEEVNNILNIYPQVKGVQVMNTDAQYLVKQYRGRWMPDSSARRRVILQKLRTWTDFAPSTPVKGVTAAIETFYDADKKISVYVFGDDFQGRSVTDVVQNIDRINREDAGGNRLVRIHGVGFSGQLSTASGMRFATLMRELTQRNGGTFVAVNDSR